METIMSHDPNEDHPEAGSGRAINKAWNELRDRDQASASTGGGSRQTDDDWGGTGADLERNPVNRPRIDDQEEGVEDSLPPGWSSENIEDDEDDFEDDDENLPLTDDPQRRDQDPLL
jgi:hypothetical protein